MKRNQIKKITFICSAAILFCGLIGCKDAVNVDIISGADQVESEETKTETESVIFVDEEETTPECDLTLVPGSTEAQTEISAIPELTETAAAQCEPTSPEAPSKALIDSYGYEEDGKSVLSFDIQPGEVIDGGDYYEVTAIYGQAIKVPTDLEVGESVTLVFNEMTGETKTLTLQSEGSLLDEAGMDYYYWPSEDGSPVDLYWFSDDRVDKPICEEKLYIRKSATSEVVIAETVEFITEEMLENGAWYNGVYFDEQGYVIRLCFIGD